MLLKRFAVLACTIVAMAGSASAAVFGYTVEGGGTAQVYQLENGNYLGLVGFDTRNAAQTGGTVGIVDLTSAILSNAASVQGFFYGSSSLTGSASEFDRLADDVALILANGTRYFDALWIEWTGGNLVLDNGRGGRSTLGANVSLAGDPLAPVPLPASGLLLLAGVGGVAALRRRKRA